MKEPLIYEPSTFSRVFNRLAETASEKLEESLTGGFFARARLEGRVRAYFLNGYKNVFQEIRYFELPERTGDRRADIEALVGAFEELYEKIVFNNVALAHLTKGEEFSVDVSTKEDEKNQLLGKLSKDESLCDLFKDSFGHYAFNAYEVRERRFSEYSCKELREIGAVMAGVAMAEKPSAEEYFDEHSGSITPTHLVAIRELGKYQALRIVAAIRAELLEIEKERDMEQSIFDQSYKALLETL